MTTTNKAVTFDATITNNTNTSRRASLQAAFTANNNNNNTDETTHQSTTTNNKPNTTTTTATTSAESDQQRRERRRNRARGSPAWRYLAVRLQLRAFLSSTRNLGSFFALLMFAIIMWILVVYGRPPSNLYWEDINTKWGGDLGNFSSCETRLMDEFTQQRVDGFATVAHVLVGCFMCTLWFVDSKHNLSFEARFGNLPASLLLRQPAWSLLMGTSNLFLGCMSWLRHANNSYVAYRLEITAYWCVLFAYCTCGLARMLDPPRKVRTKNKLLISYVVTLMGIFTTVSVDVALGIRNEVFRAALISEIAFGAIGFLLSITIFLHWYLHRLTIETEMWYFPLSVLSLGGGLTLFSLDNTILCRRNGNGLQAYAGWHALCAFSSLTMYLFFRSDVWIHGDGAETTPKIRILIQTKICARNIYEFFSDACVTKEELRKRRASRHRTRSGRRVTIKKDGQIVDDNGYVVPQARLKTQKSFRSLLNPELGFTQQQIRVFEFFCGIGMLSLLGVVLWLAFTRT
jgi:hypothetical protein